MDRFMELAMAEAEAGMAEGGIPIGSVLVCDGKVLGSGRNQRVQLGSAIRHGKWTPWRTPVVTRPLSTPAQPCIPPCPLRHVLRRHPALWHPHVVIGENKSFRGEEDLLISRGVELEVLDDPDCIALMEQFIRENPELWNEDIGV